MAFGFGSLSGQVGQTDKTAATMMKGQLGAAQGMGFFNPMGSPAIRAALKRRAIRGQANRRRRGEVLSRLLGLGPQEQRQAMIDTERESSGQLAGALNEAEYNQLAGSQDWLRRMLSGERGMEHERQMAEERRKWEESQRGGIGSTLGTLVGMGAGAFTGGLGTSLAEKVF